MLSLVISSSDPSLSLRPRFWRSQEMVKAGKVDSKPSGHGASKSLRRKTRTEVISLAYRSGCSPNVNKIFHILALRTRSPSLFVSEIRTCLAEESKVSQMDKDAVFDTLERLCQRLREAEESKRVAQHQLWELKSNFQVNINCHDTLPSSIVMFTTILQVLEAELTKKSEELRELKELSSHHSRPSVNNNNSSNSGSNPLNLSNETNNNNEEPDQRFVNHEHHQHHERSAASVDSILSKVILFYAITIVQNVCPVVF